MVEIGELQIWIHVYVSERSKGNASQCQIKHRALGTIYMIGRLALAPGPNQRGYEAKTFLFATFRFYHGYQFLSSL